MTPNEFKKLYPDIDEKDRYFDLSQEIEITHMFVDDVYIDDKIIKQLTEDDKWLKKKIIEKPAAIISIISPGDDSPTCFRQYTTPDGYTFYERYSMPPADSAVDSVDSQPAVVVSASSDHS